MVDDNKEEYTKECETGSVANNCGIPDALIGIKKGW